MDVMLTIQSKRLDITELQYKFQLTGSVQQQEMLENVFYVFPE